MRPIPSHLTPHEGEGERGEERRGRLAPISSHTTQTGTHTHTHIPPPTAHMMSWESLISLHHARERTLIACRFHLNGHPSSDHSPTTVQPDNTGGHHRYRPVGAGGCKWSLGVPPGDRQREYLDGITESPSHTLLSTYSWHQLATRYSCVRHVCVASVNNRHG